MKLISSERSHGLLAALLGAAALAAAAIPASDVKAAEGKTKIVFLAGGPSHTYGAHEHRAGCLLLAKCLNENMPNVEAVVYSGWPENAKVLKDAAAIVAYCDGNNRHVLSGHLEEVGQLMKQGVGLVCLHYAVELPPGAQGEKLRKWIGGYFEVNWSVNPHWTAEFKRFPKHPIARGVSPFSIEDEWYYHMRFRDNMEGVTPILTAVPPLSTLDRPDGAHSNNPVVRDLTRRRVPQHVAWACQRDDGGRGFGFTGGHWHWNWGDDNFRTVVLNGIVWAAGMEVPSGGVPSPTPTREQLEANLDEAPPSAREKGSGLFSGSSGRIDLPPWAAP